MLVAGGMAVGFRQSAGASVMVPLRTVRPGRDGEELSHVSSNGMGRVAPTNRLKRLEAPFAPLISVDTAGAVVWASDDQRSQLAGQCGGVGDVDPLDDGGGDREDQGPSDEASG